MKFTVHTRIASIRRIANSAGALALTLEEADSEKGLHAIGGGGITIESRLDENGRPHYYVGQPVHVTVEIEKEE